MQERRRHDRSRAFCAGTVASGDNHVALTCVVRNVSAAGALLLVEEPRRAPCDLDLTFPRGGGTRRARVVWRGETEVGVVFTSAAETVAPPPAHATIVSLADARRSRIVVTDAERLAERVAQVAGPASRPRPHWAWPRMTR